MTSTQPSKRPMPRHYSGEASRAFWARVNSIKDPKLRMVVYQVACALQDMEGRMAQILEAAGEATRPQVAPGPRGAT